MPTIFHEKYIGLIASNITAVSNSRNKHIFNNRLNSVNPISACHRAWGRLLQMLCYNCKASVNQI